MDGGTTPSLSTEQAERQTLRNSGNDYMTRLWVGTGWECA